MKFKYVGRYDPSCRTLGVCRWMWQRGVVGDGRGYSAKLSIALKPTLFRIERGFHEWGLTILGVRVHKMCSFGGIYV